MDTPEGVQQPLTESKSILVQKENNKLKLISSFAGNGVQLVLLVLLFFIWKELQKTGECGRSPLGMNDS